MIVIDSAELPSHKTHALATWREKHGWGTVYVVQSKEEYDSEAGRKAILASSNIGNIRIHPSKAINVYDMLQHHILILTRAALNEIQERLLKGQEEQPKEEEEQPKEGEEESNSEQSILINSK